MVEFHLNRWLFAAVVGIVVAVGFDGVLHGLSHRGHGFLEPLWKGEDAQRTCRTSLLPGIGWHIAADVLMAILISLVVVAVREQGLVWMVLVGVLAGGIATVLWIHVYAAFEIGGRTTSSLAGLNLIQAILVSLAVALIYGDA